MKIVAVGDPHARARDLDDVAALMAYAEKLAIDHDATLFVSGDLHHEHGVISAVVQHFWHTFFRKLKVPCIALAGNHDFEPGTDATPLLAYSKFITTVLYEPHVERNILFCPYVDDPKRLVEWSQKYSGCGTLICHQTFDGAQFESGFYAQDAISPDLISQKKIVSGHIHKMAEFGKVFYIGSPRWLTLSDANENKAIWLLDFDVGGNLIGTTAFSTNHICKRILHYIDTPENPVNIAPDKDEVRIDIKGPESWINERKALFQGCKVRTFKTDSNSKMKVKESLGVGVAFKQWVDGFIPGRGTSKEILSNLVKDRLDGI